MKYLEIYNELKLKNNENEIFESFMNNLTDSIFTWDYFVNFSKVKENVNNFEIELNLLNVLIGKKNIEEEFIALIKEYPKVRRALPILIAVRMSKLKELKITSNFKELISENKKDLFDYKINLDKKLEKEILVFFRESGLKDVFLNKDIKNLVDYCFGVEVGMDTNGRKNRTGSSMEKLIEKKINEFCLEYDLEFISQATKKHIKEKWNYHIDIDKINRRFDFAIFNKSKNKLFLVEVNYYGSKGSKLKATAGEYKSLEELLKPQGIDLIWITDGLGWKTAKKALFETFIHNDYLFNIDLIKKGILKDVIL